MGYRFADSILDKVTVDSVMQELEEEECTILRLYYVEEMTFEEIGEIVGAMYRDPPKPLTGSAIRYHRDKILDKLAKLMGKD